MTDPNAPVAKGLDAALGHLQILADSRQAAIDAAERWLADQLAGIPDDSINPEPEAAQ